MTSTIRISSALRGLANMKVKHLFRSRFWAIRAQRPIGFWLHLWTPNWHEGRGVYLSLGLGLVAIYRGY